jgi:hypothetical protein
VLFQRTLALATIAVLTAACDEAPAPAAAPAAAVVPTQQTNDITYNIEFVSETNAGTEIGGWAFIDKADSAGSEIFVILKAGENQRMFPAAKGSRQDVSKYFKNPSLDDTGFSALIQKGAMTKGEYRIGLYIKRGTQQALEFTEKTVALN